MFELFHIPLLALDKYLILTKLESTYSPPALSRVGSNTMDHDAEQARDGRAAMIVDGKMRWITEDGTPGESVGDGNFYFTQFHDGTFRLLDSDSRNERRDQFSKSPSIRFYHFSYHGISDCRTDDFVGEPKKLGVQ